MVGEHIRTRRGGHWTHGIDCGDQTIIHLAEDASRVLRSYRPEFVSRAEAVEVVTHRERTFPAGEIVARAYSRIADPALAAMFRDSEAFAEWCATGRLPAAPPNLALGLEVAPRAPALKRSAAKRPAKPAKKAAPAWRRKAAAPVRSKKAAPRGRGKAAPARAKAAKGRAAAKRSRR